ncbi:MAG: TrkA family potassium uptake protein [Actinomycetales bacterium]|nr:TrkA family potassium uptake protein [Actinomycetales bacterium]
MKVVIAGAGKVGRAIARELIANHHDVLLVDRDPQLAVPGVVQGASVLLADACEVSSLDQADLPNCQVVVAATGDDKVNLVVSLLAKTEYGVPRVVARVNHPKNEWMFDESWGVDVAVSTPRMLSALVEEAVTVGDLVRLFSFRQGNANLVEMTLASDSPVVGQRVGDQAWPPDTALVAIVRGPRVITPSADEPLDVGDELLFVAAPEHEYELQVMLGHA